MSRISTEAVIGMMAWSEASAARSSIRGLHAEFKSQSGEIQRAVQNHAEQLSRIENSLQAAQDSAEQQLALRQKVFLVRNSLNKIFKNNELEDGEKFFLIDNISEPILSVTTEDLEEIKDKEYLSETLDMIEDFKYRFSKSNPGDAFIFNSLKKYTELEAVSQNYLYQNDINILTNRAQKIVERRASAATIKRRFIMTGLLLIFLVILFNVGTVSSFFGVLVFAIVALLIAQHGIRAWLEADVDVLETELEKIVARYNEESGTPLKRSLISSANFATIRDVSYRELDVSVEELERLGVKPQIEENELVEIMNDAAERVQELIETINKLYKNLQLTYAKSWKYAPGAADKALQKIAELEPASASWAHDSVS